MERCNRGYEEGNNETEAKKFDNQRRKKKGMNNVSLVYDSHLEKKNKAPGMLQKKNDQYGI